MTGSHVPPWDRELAAARVKPAQSDPLPFPLPADSRLVVTDRALVVVGPAGPWQPHQVLSELPLTSVEDLTLRPLRLRPTLTITATDGTTAVVTGRGRELARVVNAYRREMSPTAAVRPAIPNPFVRWLSTAGMRGAIVAASALLLIGLAAASVVAVQMINEQDTADGLTRGRRLAPEDLRVGDCFDTPPEADGTETADVRLVDVMSCTEPHDSEVFAVEQYPDAEAERFPGQETAFQVAYEHCIPLFEEVVGQPPGEDLDIFLLVPTQMSWSMGDRNITCSAYLINGDKLTAPLSEGAPTEGETVWRARTPRGA